MSVQKIPLREIERSIKVNSAIDITANKPLQFRKWQGLNNQGIGRCIFIYIAVNSGYNREEICDYLTITGEEFDHKREILQDLYQGGKILFETTGAGGSYLETRDTYLFFYRKLVLAQNYLRYRFGI